MRYDINASPSRWRQYGSLKIWYPTTSLHGVTTQKKTWVCILVSFTEISIYRTWCGIWGS